MDSCYKQIRASVYAVNLVGSGLGNYRDRLLPLSATLAELCQDYGIVEVVLGLGDRCEVLAIASELQGEADESMYELAEGLRGLVEDWD